MSFGAIDLREKGNLYTHWKHPRIILYCGEDGQVWGDEKERS